MRYLVFRFNTYYPNGGMNDCILKTNLLEVAISRAVYERDENFYHVHVYDKLKDEFVPLPEED